MTESKTTLSAEKIQEAESKFWMICDYISARLRQGEELSNWYVGTTDKKDGRADTYLALKNKFPGMDESTWREFHVTDEQVAALIKHTLVEHGLETDEQQQSLKADNVYVFRKKYR